MTIDWSKAPADATHARSPRAFRKKDLDGSWLGWRSYDKPWKRITVAYPERYTARLSAVTWNGEGLPPIGVLVEDRSVGGAPIYLCEVIGVEGADIAIRRPGCIKVVHLTQIRPIRTAEQIAAEERSKSCDAMFGVLMAAKLHREGNRSDICEALYDAGYRKQELQQ